MDKRSWRQVRTVSIVRDPSKIGALANVWKLGLDARKVKDHLAVHPHLERPGEVTARRDHRLELYPLTYRNNYRRGISSVAAFPGMRSLGRSLIVRAPVKRHRHPRAADAKNPDRVPACG